MPGKPYDPEAFRRFEHEGWERLSAGYHHHWEALTTQAIPAMLAAVEIMRRDRVLDVACGPGYVAGAVAARRASVVGVDFSDNMIALARRNFPGLDFRNADAQNLPFADADFDAALINFGMLHFSEPEKALLEAYRVLKPGGRLAFTNWAPAEESAITIAMNAIAQAGSLRVELPAGTPLYRFADPDECHIALTGAGFGSVSSTPFELSWRLPRADLLMETFSQATARMSGLLAAQSPDALPAIGAAMAEACAPYDQGDVTILPMPAMLTVATKA